MHLKRIFSSALVRFNKGLKMDIKKSMKTKFACSVWQCPDIYIYN
jgi:hypothetical protein